MNHKHNNTMTNWKRVEISAQESGSMVFNKDLHLWMKLKSTRQWRIHRVNRGMSPRLQAGGQLC